MGYESKIQIYDCYQVAGKKYGNLITEFNLSKMGGNNFLNTFTNEIDFDIYDYEYESNLSNERKEDLFKSVMTKTDKYGDVCRYCSVKALIEALERYQREQEHYRRITPLLAMLKGFDETEWENLVCVHYGY